VALKLALVCGVLSPLLYIAMIFFVPTLWLMAAFGWGVWRSAGHNRALHAVGGLILVHGLIGLYWPPMHVRGAELTLTDTMHIVWSMATVLLMTLAMGFGEAPSRADGPPGLRARLRRAPVLPRPSREI
jgi:hypothetical protein